MLVSYAQNHLAGPSWAGFALAFALIFLPIPTQADTLRLMVIDIAKPGIDLLVPSYEKQFGHQVSIETASADKLIARIESGAALDVIILDAANLDRLEARKRLRNLEVAELGRTGLGVAVRAGSQLPPFFTEDETKAGLSAARSIAHADPASGSNSGTLFQFAISKLGLTDKLNAKLRVLPSPQAVSQAVGAGDIDLAIGIASELVGRPGVAFAGFLPHSLQKWTVIRAMRVSDNEAARAFIDHIADDGSLKIFARGGFR